MSGNASWVIACEGEICGIALTFWSPRHADSDDWQTAAERTQPATPGIDEAVALHHLIDTLDPDRREAFFLTQTLGLPYADAATVCRVPIGTIRSRVSRARDDLIAALTTDEPRDNRPAI